ncbi:hypothetical protein JOE61_003855 [Nocardioides salarius]|uniref:Uncharacterized protein n=1 Tax=Nocardioides salarius TaxID=374513 RepID=A0ABS2MFS8_9ACTN|nr:hypothetical protein [Nocardioides salarius]MBM7510041.1 hypothetical protein [Nocardioides salarius]
MPSKTASPSTLEETAEQMRAAQSQPQSSKGSRGGEGFFDGAERRFDSAARTAGGLTLTPPRRLTANDGAGFLGGLFLYVLALNYLRYGKEGVTGWLGAKFVNRPWTPPDDGGAEDGARGTTRDDAGVRVLT